MLKAAEGLPESPEDTAHGLWNPNQGAALFLLHMIVCLPCFVLPSLLSAPPLPFLPLPPLPHPSPSSSLLITLSLSFRRPHGTSLHLSIRARCLSVGGLPNPTHTSHVALPLHNLCLPRAHGGPLRRALGGAGSHHRLYPVHSLDLDFVLSFHPPPSLPLSISSCLEMALASVVALHRSSLSRAALVDTIILCS